MACYGDNFTFVYVDDVRTSEETHLRASTACYWYNFTFLDVDDVCTSQETQLRASTTCYWDNFTFLDVDDVRTSQAYVPQRPVTGTAVLYFICTVSYTILVDPDI
jgi:hypothetical protein